MAVEQVPAPPEGAPGKKRTGRAGRNLPVAIGVGVVLATLITVPLYTVRWVWVAVIVVAIAGATWEMARAIATVEARPPLPPLVAGGAVMIVLAYTHGAGALVGALLLTVVGCLLWRLPGGPVGYLRDVASGALVAAYVPFLAGFAALLTVPPDGPRRVTAFIATVVCSDVGGLAAGVLFGRHPLAPTVSPRKSWEGFAGSALACAVAGVVFLTRLFPDGTVLEGLAYGLAITVTATLGDLGESMLKRDLAIKDMGTLLPGHGGLMDRLDSLLPSAPVAFLLLTAFVPPS